MSLIRIEHELDKSPGGNVLLRRPANIGGHNCWNRVTVVALQAGQSRAYADSVYSAEISFEGGLASNITGMDIPFFTKPHEFMLKKIAKAVFCDWEDTPGPFDSRLTECRLIERTETYSIWKFTVVIPYCD